MKRINHFRTAHDKLLHILTEGAIINITVGLTDSKGRAVTSVEIIPDNGWIVDGSRIIQERMAGTALAQADDAIAAIRAAATP